MSNMNDGNYKLYAGKYVFFFSSMEEAKDAAKEFIPKGVYLRIEILAGIPLEEADWWAYEYENNRWAPS